MVKSGFIAAIDLGTSKITGIVAHKNENNVISVLACETTPSDGCIRRGLVYNINETSASVRKVINKLENKLSKGNLGGNIAKVYVSVAGQSLHTVQHTVSKQLLSTGLVTDDIINQMYNEAKEFEPDLRQLYKIADVEYIINGKAESQPVGVATTEIEGNYQMIVGRPNIVKNIEKSIQENAGVEIADFVIGPLASANIALNDDEKELGCAFVDFGAGTTSVSIFKEGKLRHMVVIPFGGATITKDISELNLIEKDAEDHKIKYGKIAKPQKEGADKTLNKNKADTGVDFIKLNRVIEMRVQEIVLNIKEQIRISGYQGKLGAGLIITGGASNLRNLDTYLEDKLDMPVRKASAKRAYVNNFPDLANDPAFTQALGLLLYGNENCEEVVVEEEIEEERNIDVEEKVRPNFNKAPKGKSIRNKFGELFGKMFEDDDSEDE